MLRNIFSSALFGCVLLTATLGAQNLTVNERPSSQLEAENLPNAPRPVLHAGEVQEQKAAQNADSSLTAILFGIVQDKNQMIVPDASIRLENLDSHKDTILSSDDKGTFTITNLAAGRYKVTITGAGMGTYISPEFELKSGETHIVSGIVLPVATAQSEVHVYANKNEIAQEEMRIAERQRVIGIFPNFYVTYDWDAPALDPKQKFNLFAHATLDPVTFIGTGIVAGAEQAENTYPAYGQGLEGYSKRYGAAFTTGTINNLFGGAVYPVLFRQDPRYFYKGTGSVKSRLFYALEEAVMCRGDNGRQQPNYSGILGSVTAGAISNLYYPASDRGVSLTFLNTLVGIGGSAAADIIEEFFLKRFTTHSKDTAPALHID
jgi:hypothetical protein